MNFGVIFAAICCCLIPIAVIRNISDTLNKKPKWYEVVIYVVAPVGVAIGTYYYIFFVRDFDVAAAFTKSGSTSVLSDLIIDFLIPTVILSGLFISYQLYKNVCWHFFVITLLGFLFLSWAYIIYETILFSQDFGPAQNPEFPNVLWAIAVFVSGLIVALFEMRTELLKKQE